ncbi:MAG: D-aminoacyl-tRNA deacylase [Nitrospiraceae bacterium]
MKAVLQRVQRAGVTVDGQTVGAIEAGLVVLLGVATGDTDADVRYLVEKVATLRIFSDQAGKMNRSVVDVAGAVLLVSQFTLLANTADGRRPSFEQAAPPDVARTLYEAVASGLRDRGVSVAQGVFGAHMLVELVNDGPVTLLLDSRRPARELVPSPAQPGRA